MILRGVEVDPGAASLSSHHVTVCFFFMSSGETSWVWYVTQSSLLESNKSPAADCSAVCLCGCNVEISSATRPLSAAHLLPNPHARPVSLSLCLSLLCSLKRNIIYTSACGIKACSRGRLIHQHARRVAERQSLRRLTLDGCHRKSLSFTGRSDRKKTELCIFDANRCWLYWWNDFLCFNPERLTASGWLWNSSTIYEPQPVNIFS